nr:hypothetical protein [Tanacetum cinerariifolium]
MSDSDESGVTYTDISSPFEELSDIGSTRADDHEHLMLPEMLEDPYVEAPSAEETEPFETDESTATPPPHPAYPLPSSPIHSLGYRAAMIRLRDEAASTSHSPPLQLPSASRREDRPEVTLPPRKRLDIALGPRYEVGESSSAAARPAGGFRADYGFVAMGAPVSTNTELRGYVREFETRVRQDTDEIYMRLDDEQNERHLLAGRLNVLFRDRRAHAYTRQLMETEARMSREAWVRATDLSGLVHGEGQQGLAGDHTQSELPEEAGG